MKLVRLTTLVAAAALASVTLLAAPAQAETQRHHDDEPGTRSLAAVLAKDGRSFDRNPLDFDILEAAVYAVLEAKPDSAVGVLADGTTALTAFLPTDSAFAGLVNDVAGREGRSEAETFAVAATLGIDTIEAVLLYHVVPGATIDYRSALRADGAELSTALAGSSVEVDVRRFFGFRYVSLKDADTDDRNAIVLLPNINRGNLQIAHGITDVMRPVDLP